MKEILREVVALFALLNYVFGYQHLMRPKMAT
jgi:hypothetical protein